jgi:ribosomal protein S18 acetylase RimI-like enzyme
MKSPHSRSFVVRLAESEYTKVVDPSYAREVRFGTFYTHPAFPDRTDANQLLRVHCGSDQLLDLKQEIEDLYRGSALPFRKISGYGPQWDALLEALCSEGWIPSLEKMMVHREESQRSPNAELMIRTVAPSDRDLERLYIQNGVVDRGFVYARQQSERLGGEYIVGYVDDRAACCTGWFISHGIARFRHVYTMPWARNRGYAGTLIQHVQSHPRVRDQDALVIFVGDGGPAKLYEALGFRTEGVYYSARKRIDSGGRTGEPQ